MKILAIVLAAGRGSRIRHLLSEDEPVKPLLRVEGKTLLEHALQRLESLPVDRAVLSFPSEEYRGVEAVASKMGARLLVQSAKQLSLPTILELPYILLSQYHLSKDRAFLRSYDAIITLPCDLLLSRQSLQALVDKWSEVDLPSKKARITLLSREKVEGERADFFKITKGRIAGYRPSQPKDGEAWRELHQTGVYMFSRGLLSFPLVLLRGVSGVYGQVAEISEIATDYGDPKTLEKLRLKKV